MQFNNIFVVQDVVSLGVLAVIYTGAPNPCEFEFFSQFPVYSGGQVHNCGTSRQRERLTQIGFFARWFGIDAYDA